MTRYGNIWSAQSETVCALLANNNSYNLMDAEYKQVTWVCLLQEKCHHYKNHPSVCWFLYLSDTGISNRSCLVLAWIADLQSCIVKMFVPVDSGEALANMGSPKWCIVMIFFVGDDSDHSSTQWFVLSDHLFWKLAMFELPAELITEVISILTQALG